MTPSISFISRVMLSAFILSFASTGIAEAITLTFQEKISGWEAFDLGALGPSVGDMDTGNGIVLDVKGNQIGTIDFQSIVTHKANLDVKWLNAQYTFNNGLDSIIIQGTAEHQSDTQLLKKDIPYYYSVTGGTGKYAGAKGVCKVVRVTDDMWNNTCKFQALKIKF